MGKTRKVKTRSKKVNPLGVPTIAELENVDLSDSEFYPHGPIQAITEQLQSPSIEEKMNALQSLAILANNRQKVSDICASDIIRIAAPFLTYSNQGIRNSTAGALRNLSVNGFEVCEHMVEQDVLTPLLALLNEYATESWTPQFDSSMENQLDEKSDTFVQAINLLWNLCESTSVALDNFNQTHILESFIRCLDHKVFGFHISIAVAQCLLVISEDNPNAWIILNNFLPEFISLLNIDGGYPHLFLSTLSAGIISNAPALAAAHNNQIFTTVAKTLDVNHRIVLGEITSKLPLVEPFENSVDDSSNFMEEESEENASLRRRREDLPSKIEVEIKHIEYLLEAQRVSIEILTNMCSSEDEEWADDENNDMSDNESVHDYDVSNRSSSSNLPQADKLPVEILEAIKSLNIVEKLWQRAQPIPNNVHQILRENYFPLVKKIKSLRVSAFLCLQNLCNSMSTDDLGGPAAIYNVWLDIGQQVFQGPQDPVILEPSTSLMRAALEHLKSSSNLFKQITENDLQLMLNGVNNCSVPEIRANWLRMLGIMGCLIPENLVKVIMTFILETSLKEQDAWAMSEAIDALMDMFADNDWNEIALELNLIQKSKELEKQLKNKLRQQKRELKDRYPAVMTVRTNLGRFTKYVENQMKTFVANNSS